MRRGARFGKIVFLGVIGSLLWDIYVKGRGGEHFCDSQYDTLVFAPYLSRRIITYTTVIHTHTNISRETYIMALTSSPLINWILRAFQALFGIVILGLSVTLIRGHHWGSLPNSLGYAAFVGGVTILAALVGVAATWVSFLEGIVGVAIDGLVALLNIAGGIVCLHLLPLLKQTWTNTLRLVARY
jgi:zinc transporter ZupT